MACLLTSCNIQIMQNTPFNGAGRRPAPHPLLATIPSPTAIVSPAYGYIKSALVKCSNEGGLGPRFNMTGDQGSSIFSMLMGDGVLTEYFALF